MATQINIPYEIQSIFCSVATNFFVSKGISVYYTIPPQTTAPYIKISSLNITKQAMVNPSFVNIKLGLTIYTDGASNKQILDIVNSLDNEIVSLLNGCINTANTIIVQNSYINDCKITEIIDRRGWIANCEMVLIGGLI
jgi:hypothetical protein